MSRINALGQPVGEPVEGWTARPVPAPEVLTGRTCELAALSEELVGPLAEALLRESTGRLWTYMPMGPFTDQAQLEVWLRSFMADPAYVTLVIRQGVARDVVGMASYLRVKPTVGAIEVGMIMFTPALQRSTAATEAMYVMARHVLEELGYRRYEWKCDALNAPSQAAARRLGFAYEGTWRNAIVYEGRSRDTAWFAMTDTDWPVLRAAFDGWLAADNFDADGHQRTSLSSRTAAARAQLDGT